MTFGFNELQACLAEWPNAPPNRTASDDPLIDRIHQILATKSDGGPLANADLQPLVRHLLLRETAKSGHPKEIRVPIAPNWPTASEWARHGLSVMSVGSNAYLLSALAWHPGWLDATDEGVFADAFADKTVRENGQCPADPFIEAVTGFKYYSSPGQRESIRASFLMPPGDTLIVNLPTGSGKSLVGYAPALIHRQEGHLTLFVVPTVALAIDQARQIEPFFFRDGTSHQRWPLAWYGGLSVTERSEVKRRMLNGTQRILFTSPEALTTSLLRTVFEVACSGMLRYLVIDEAHLVTQWGDEFRPAFQAMAGLRNSLLRQTRNQPFRTLLLSATFTPETLETLANLFGPPERVQMVAAVHLRPEPQYWWLNAASADEKKERVLEALRFAPRPFILYVTTRKDARDWYKTLIGSGYQRIRLFDGQTPDDDRKTIINAWVANQLDGVVATSAFGVGIDKQDIRTIIHATIPETLDRFYQEVGRGGRDGKPAVSFLVYDDSDWSIPKTMATPAIISNELGFARWRALYDSRKDDRGDGCFSVNLDAVRTGLKGSNDENVRWNMRTLLLMSRAGFLNLELEPSSHDDLEDDDSLASVLATLATFRIRLLREDHLLPEAWEEAISSSRINSLEAGKRNLRLMQRMLVDRREVSETLADLYRNGSLQWPIEVTRVCGGCPSDRYLETREYSYNVPMAVPIHKVPIIQLDHWQAKFPHLDPKYVPVFYEPLAQKSELLRLLRWLVSECGVQEICAATNSWVAASPEVRHLYKQTASGVVIHRTHQELEEEPYTPLARVTIFDSRVTGTQIQLARLVQRPLHIVLYPLQTPDPDNPSRRLTDTVTNSTRLEQLEAVIHQ